MLLAVDCSQFEFNETVLFMDPSESAKTTIETAARKVSVIIKSSEFMTVNLQVVENCLLTNLSPNLMPISISL